MWLNIVWIDTTAIQDYIVGSATLVCLKSIANNFEKEGHIKDLIISKDHRYKGLDQSLKDALLVIAFQIESVTLLYDDSNKETKKQPLYLILTKNIFLII